MSDRPLECSQCKKCICIVYKEIENGNIDVSHMCEQCPILKKKLHGEEVSSAGLKWAAGKQGLSCMSCGTSLDTFRLGTHLGCNECYTIFEQLIIETLKTEDLIPKKMKDVLKKNKHCQLHVGKTPHEELTPMVSTQMTDLNEALSEAVKKENYEQAASLRDQIKELKEKVDDGS
jgi:protein arginine kinase activator